MITDPISSVVPLPLDVSKIAVLTLILSDLIAPLKPTDHPYCTPKIGPSTKSPTFARLSQSIWSSRALPFPLYIPLSPDLSR